ncbi:MAG: pilus assembly protein PilV [Aquabacterium sp.]|uniref:type IV pilus modification PilV family protein n=1 Tax=Aquabacterium sp. TaxID=1872578 RepID=UPI00271CAE62|nr:pilus assembly protein PilV [Aquabacterium sp.]MDO9005179.1 pilus assembly protein PilV [Aquabacterium sp.]
MKKAQAQTGFMLIEVMISVLIFSVGVIALVGLQAAMTRAQSESKVRADAANLAAELLGMIWADAANIASYATASCASAPQCAGWRNKVSLVLPSSGDSTVTVVPATGRVDVILTWTMPGGTPHQYTTSTIITTNPP